MLTLRTKQGTTIQCSKKGAKLSKFLSKNTKDVVLIDMEDELVQRIVAYLEHHANEPPLIIHKPAPDDLSTDVGVWDTDFIDALNGPQVLEVMLAADYLQISSLIDLAMAKIAVTLRHKSDNEAKQLFYTVQSTRDLKENQFKPFSNDNNNLSSNPNSNSNSTSVESIGERLAIIRRQANLVQSGVPSFNLD